MSRPTNFDMPDAVSGALPAMRAGALVSAVSSTTIVRTVFAGVFAAGRSAGGLGGAAGRSGGAWTGACPVMGDFATAGRAVPFRPVGEGSVVVIRRRLPRNE